MPYVLEGGGGGGTTTNIDAGARTLISQLLATPGTTPDIQPGDGITADNKQWQNQTGTAKPIPSPALTANMLTAGFTDVTQGGATDSLNTVGPWAGAANAGDKFGLDPASGDRYYVDNAGDWQPVISGAKNAIDAITAQPNEVIPAGGLVVTPFGMYENSTAGDITLSADDPQTDASLTAAGMTPFTSGNPETGTNFRMLPANFVDPEAPTDAEAIAFYSAIPAADRDTDDIVVYLSDNGVVASWAAGDGENGTETLSRTGYHEPASSGGYQLVPHTAVTILSADANKSIHLHHTLSVEAPLAQPDASQPARDGIGWPLGASTGTDDAQTITRLSTAEVYLMGDINGDTGAWMNNNGNGRQTVTLVGNGSGGWSSTV